MLKGIFLISATVLLTGCLPMYKLPDSKPSAEFFLDSQNDSHSTTLRTSYVWVFKDDECRRNEFGMRAGSVIKNDAAAGTPRTRILANEKFVFTATYGDARFAQNRQCAVTGSFTPLPSHTYKATLIVENNVSSCRLGVYDVSAGHDEQVEFSMPEHVCSDKGKSEIANGQPLWTNWRVKVGR